MLYPIGIQTFADIREEGYVYVDKTDLVYRLASSGRYFFLSRPRRFGKSLFISTLEAYFKGKKELFDGLAIASLEKDWTEYPVLHIDFSGESYSEIRAINTVLSQHLENWENEFGVSGADESGETYAGRFKRVIEAACAKTGKKVVILVDEYEKPIIDNLHRPELMEQFRDILQGFYSVLKAKDACIGFAFLTGVTKLGKMSIFSGLNNINDISMDAEYASICGITEEELKSNFGESVAIMAKANDLEIVECYDKLKQMYDGYHFCRNSVGMYNPFSLINAFSKKDFGEYWYATGTPTFLVKYLQQGNFNLDKIAKDGVPLTTLTGANYQAPAPITLMYQAGYLTIKSYDPVFKTYCLDYPNEEVRGGFMNSLSQLYAPELIQGEFSVYSFLTDLMNGDVDGFMTRFEAFLADNSYQIQGALELYFENVMSIMLKMMGLYVRTEYSTSHGRIDVVVEVEKYVYIIELKMNQDPDVALKQIEDKGYATPFLASGKEIIKLGINFSSETKTVGGWKRA